MSYHPDPHAEPEDWEEAFSGFNDRIKVPDTLATYFEVLLPNITLGRTIDEAVVLIVESYGDLAETLPELSIQLALKRAAPHLFQKVLAYAGRPDLTLPQEQRHELHELI